MTRESGAAKGGITKVLSAIEIGFDKVVAAMGVMAIGLMLLIAALVFALSLSRSVFHINLPGLFDGPVYALMAFPFLTMAYTLRERRHIIIDTFTTRLSERARTLLNITTCSASLVYIIILGWLSACWVPILFHQGIMTDATFRIPKGIPVSIMAFGSLLLLLQIIRMLVHDIRSLSSKTSHLKDGAWLPSSLFIVGVITGIVIYTSVNQIAGISLLTLVLLFSGMPVFLAFGLLGCLGIYFLLGSPSLMQVPIKAYESVMSFPLTCLPLFILGGLIMEQSGIGEDLFRFFELWLGRWAVSPLVVTIAAGMLFCAISGSTAATTAVIGAVALPILMRRGYNKALLCGTVGGATVGTLIPPSVGYVVSAVLTEESIGALFMATILPAIVLFAFYFSFVTILGWVSKKSLFEKGQIPSEATFKQVTWKDRFLGFKSGIWGLLAPMIIIGGIYSGMFTPTEVAALLVVYAIILSVFIKRISWQNIIKGTSKGAVLSSMLLCIIFSAYMFALVISQMRLAANLSAYVQATEITAPMVVVIIFVLLIVLGMFMEAVSIKVITLPVFYPVAMSVGINSVWLLVFYQFLMEIGGLTPPFGICLLVIKGTTGLPLNTVAKGVLPFVALMVLTVVVLYLFPQLATWLPSIIK